MRLKVAVWGLHGVTLHSKFVRSHSAGAATVSHSVVTCNLPAPARSLLWVTITTTTTQINYFPYILLKERKMQGHMRHGKAV
jgi:hypothetical protein